MSAPRTHPFVVVAVEAMGTRFAITLADHCDPAALRAAGEEALEEILNVEAELSVFTRGSLFFPFNVEAAERPVPVDPVVFGLLERALSLSERLDGAFDPTSGGLLPDEADARVGGAGHLLLDPEALTVSLARPGLWLDPGAIGRGWALERAAALLAGHGVRAALLQAGIDVACAIGETPFDPAHEARPASGPAPGWDVVIAAPEPGGARLARVSLRDRALSVSSASARSNQRRGGAPQPSGRRPIERTALAAVVGPSAIDVEAISAALLALGVEGLGLVERRFPGVEALVASPRSAGGFHVARLGGAFAAP